MSNVLYVAVDLHEKESQLAVFEQDGSLVEEGRIPTGELATFLSSLPGEKRVAMESVGFVYPIYDRLSSLQGCRVTVANVNKLQLISRSSTKHDVADARILGDLLRTNYLPVAHMRDQETREKLAVVQERVNYGLKRGELRGSVRWLLKRRGIEVEKPFGPEGRARLRALRLQEVDNRLAELDLAESILLERLDADGKGLSFYATNMKFWESKKVLQTQAMRWPIEGFHRDAKQSLGLEDYQVRKIRGRQAAHSDGLLRLRPPAARLWI